MSFSLSFSTGLLGGLEAGGDTGGLGGGGEVPGRVSAGFVEEVAGCGRVALAAGLVPGAGRTSPGLSGAMLVEGEVGGVDAGGFVAGGFVAAVGVVGFVDEVPAGGVRTGSVPEGRVVVVEGGAPGGVGFVGLVEEAAFAGGALVAWVEVLAGVAGLLAGVVAGAVTVRLVLAVVGAAAPVPVAGVEGLTAAAGGGEATGGVRTATGCGLGTLSETLRACVGAPPGTATSVFLRSTATC